ncbi:DNA adenine methylase [Salinisphaera sp. RV14]|uniref:DNA adenine methylase n=1 Tax=Salinisphaera sp. RV14 TaxID=3454140 RepID=UPI003F849A0F
MQTSFHTPLRYPGGKARLGPWIAFTMRHNHISGGTYAEPYAGGAGAAIFLLLNGFVKNIVINDIDPAVHAFWYSVLNDTQRLISLVQKTPVTLETWYTQREILAKGDLADPLSLGFACFFLNRTNRSGILTAGVIGGTKQDGKYLIDARYNRNGLIDRVEKIARKRNSITLRNLDGQQFIAECVHRLDSRSLLYLDPPYYNKGPKLYRNHYDHSDHEAIAEQVRKVETPWLVSYDDAAPLKKFYEDVKSYRVRLTYSANESRAASELLFYNNLALPMAPVLSRTPTGYPRHWDSLVSSDLATI